MYFTKASCTIWHYLLQAGWWWLCRRCIRAHIWPIIKILILTNFTARVWFSFTASVFGSFHRWQVVPSTIIRSARLLFLLFLNSNVPDLLILSTTWQFAAAVFIFRSVFHAYLHSIVDFPCKTHRYSLPSHELSQSIARVSHSPCSAPTLETPTLTFDLQASKSSFIFAH